jgi:hypothetical protein
MLFTLRRGSKGLRTRKIRLDEHGVTRRTPTDPLLAFTLSEVFTPLASAPCFHGTSLMGFHASLSGKPPISTLALQSFKEPEDRLVSFENCRPPRLVSSAVTSRTMIRLRTP